MEEGIILHRRNNHPVQHLFNLSNIPLHPRWLTVRVVVIAVVIIAIPLVVLIIGSVDPRRRVHPIHRRIDLRVYLLPIIIILLLLMLGM
jgi:surface polysaccharide O-acyltransferase-like enzyme